MALGERGECFHCHVGFNLTNNTFANNGMAGGDTGRKKITRKADDRGKFKVPTLRNVALTGPYMDDGSLATLRDPATGKVRHALRGHDVGVGPVLFTLASTLLEIWHARTARQPSAP